MEKKIKEREYAQKVIKENEEKARTKVMKLIEDKKVPRGLIYPSNNKDHAEQIDKIM